MITRCAGVFEVITAASGRLTRLTVVVGDTVFQGKGEHHIVGRDDQRAADAPYSGRGLLVQASIGLLAAAIGAAAFELTKAFAMMRIVQRGNASVQCGVWDRPLNMPVSFFRNYTAGDLAMSANSISEISTLLKGPAILAALAANFTSFNLVLMFYYSSRLALTGAGLIAVALGIVLCQFTTHRGSNDAGSSRP